MSDEEMGQRKSNYFILANIRNLRNIGEDIVAMIAEIRKFQDVRKESMRRVILTAIL